MNLRNGEVKNIYKKIYNSSSCYCAPIKNKLYTFAVKHKQHMREYRQKLAKSREISDNRTDEDLFKRFDELELEEELEAEICRLSARTYVLSYTKL